jgi:hypothetical protein
MASAGTLLSAVIWLALCFETSAISVIVAALKGLVGEVVADCAVFSAIVGFLLCVGAILNLTDPDGEKAIEQELRITLEKGDRPQS